jgi:Tol biopolymer transport system component
MRKSTARTAVAGGRSFRLLAVLVVVTMSIGSASSASSEPRENTSKAAGRGYPAAALSSLRGKIAYSPGAHAHSLWVMNADGSHRRQITHPGTHADYDPDWSPDGRNIVFRTERGRYDQNSTGAQGIFVVNTRTLRERQIQPRTGGLFPAWAPNGKRIAFTGLNPTCCGEVIVTTKPDGSDKRIVKPPTDAAECLVWSPDSTKIAFCGHQGDGNWAVWVMNADGSNPHQLTHPRAVALGGSGGDSPCAWSPDGKKIVYWSWQPHGGELFIANSDGSEVHQITHWDGGDDATNWLPDGRIVFVHSAPNKLLGRWYIMNADGSNIESLPQLNRVKAGDPIDWFWGR